MESRRGFADPVTISSSTTVRALAYKSGFSASNIGTASYDLIASSPVFNPVPGTYANVQTVTITSPTSGATIRYTTDGSTPTESIGTIYSGPVDVDGSSTLRAIAYRSGFSASFVTSGAYELVAAAPIFSSSAGNTVAMSSTTSGATIRYTTDGSMPTESNGAIYTDPVGITSATVLKAISLKGGFTDSAVTTATIGIPTITITTPANGSTVGAP